MNDSAALQVWTRRGRPFGGRLAHEAGGLCTLELREESAPRLEVGDVVQWRGASESEQAPRRTGTIASTYRTATALNIVVSVSDELERSARRSPSRPAAPMPIRPSIVHPVATAIAQGELHTAPVRALSREAATVYHDASAAARLPLGSEVKLSIALPGRRSELHFWAIVVRIQALRHGALLRYEFDDSVPGFMDQQAAVTAYIGHERVRSPASGATTPEGVR